MNIEFQTALHWIYVAVMVAGSLIVFTLSRNPRGVPAYEYAIAAFIPIWSGLAYTAMALNQGKLEVAGQIAHYARYADWVVTTPLLLLALSSTAMFSVAKNYTLIASLMGTQVIVIVAGLIADLSGDGTQRYLWYSIGVGAFFVVLWGIWGRLMQIAATQSQAVGSAYRRAATYFTVFWVCYPVVWIIGPSGLGLIDQNWDTLLFVILPIFSKVGFSLYDLSLLRGLDEGKSPSQGRRLIPTNQEM
jgi:bacteriorhodopsin